MIFLHLFLPSIRFPPCFSDVLHMYIIYVLQIGFPRGWMSGSVGSSASQSVILWLAVTIIINQLVDGKYTLMNFMRFLITNKVKWQWHQVYLFSFYFFCSYIIIVLG